MKPRLVAVVLAALSGVACGNLLDPAAALVNGDKIPMDEVNRALERFTATSQFEQLSQQQAPQALKKEFERGYLAQLIRSAVLAPEAARRGIEITEQDVRQQIDEIKAEYPSEEAFEEDVAAKGVTLEQLEILVRDRALEEALREDVTAGVGPDATELRGYYEANIDDYRQTRAQHILVKDQALAGQLAAQLQTAPSDQVDDLFGELAAEHSTDEATAGKAGDLGYFAPGELVRPFERAAAELAIGEVSDPVRSDFGYHVIRVTDRRTRSFEQVRDDIEGRLAGPEEDQAWDAFLARLYERADIKVNPRYGELDPETQQIVDPDADSVPGAEEPSPQTGPAEPDPGASPS